MPPKFKDLLHVIDMSINEEACPGLVRVDEETLAAKKQADAPLEEIIALERALHFKADFVYFRRFLERPAMATAYLYDRTETLAAARRSTSKIKTAPTRPVGESLVDLHRAVWSAGEVPLVYVFLPTEVQIFHVLQGPKEDKQTIEANPWQIIQVGSEIADALEDLKAFSARRLDDGRFWEEHPDARTLKLEGAAFMALSQEIGECRSLLTHEHGVDDELVRRLLILFVLIKYLEERKDAQGQGVFPEGTFAKFATGAQGFVDLLRAGGPAVLAFLDQLAQKDRFNGDVFLLTPNERSALRDTDLCPFADLLDARIEHGQRTFWRRYAFNELPVELISHLYEQFLPRQPGVVYTPPFLVNFILDEVLPLSQRTPDSFRLIDPACGSGVFLVGAFKRLVHRWRRDNGFRYPDVETLKALLRKHIFGVDSEGEAIRLTMFSLSVALCDLLQPRVIWDELHFDRLQADNLINDDFFTQVRLRKWDNAAGFDLVVGNPPFKSKLTPSASAEVADLKARDPDFDLPDCQVALLFLKTATRIAKPSGQIALVEPAGPLLYGESSSRFRRHFLEQVHVPQIVDFTHLSRVLFKRQRVRSTKGQERRNSDNPGDVAVTVVFAENRAPIETPILHVTVRRTVQAEQKLLFEIDHYDLHFVPREEAIRNPGIWKMNFIGGGRIPHLVRRLNRLRNLGEFLKKATQERGWDSGEGYISGDQAQIERMENLLTKASQVQLSTKENAELDKLKVKFKQAPWLTEHHMLPTEAFTAQGIDTNKVEKIKERFFYRGTRPTLYEGPLLLVKEVFEAETGQLPVVLLREGIRFKDRIFGIHAPKSDLSKLRQIHATINDHRLTHFHILATSPEYLVNKSSAFRTADLLKLPFPDSPDELALTPVEDALIDDALDHVADFKRKGEASAVQRLPSRAQLRQFGEFFCRVLGSVYSSLRAAEPAHLPGGICYPFYFGETPSEVFAQGNAGVLQLEALLTATVGSSLRCQRVLRVFSGNMLLLVKPPQLRYWLRSIAIRDADEVFIELQERGY